MTEIRPTRFELIPTVVKNLIIINSLVYFAQVILNDQGQFWATFGLHTFQSPLFRGWQLITHLFVHADLGHLFGNMFGLWIFGAMLESVWGPKRFLLFYLVCGLGAGLIQQTIAYFQVEDLMRFAEGLGGLDKNTFLQTEVYPKLAVPSIGASGAVYGVMAGFGYLFPNTYIYFYFMFPVQAKFLVAGYIALSLFYSIRSVPGDNVAHIAHLGGAVVGLALVYFWNKTNRRRFY